ncbi:MAG: CPBP family intramembrane metalloprotease [Saprospiraceae bacterium]|nr:CPBP family intramembrane metalloprotease [Saprospiraceae bacterium]
MDFQNETPPASNSFEWPPFVVLLLLVVAAMVGGAIGGGLAYGWTTMQGIDLQALINDFGENSPRNERDAIRIVNLLSHFASFTLTSLAVGLLVYRKRWISYFMLEKFPNSTVLITGILFIIVAFPLVQLSYWINSQLPMPIWATDLEKAAEEMIKGILVMNDPGEFLLNLLIIAVLPAIGEELLFRGIVQQQLQRALSRPAVAIWLTAIIFSAIHMQFAGFIPRLILGATLGYLFYWTKNLWMPILAHFATNAMQVIAQYASGGKLSQAELEKPDGANWLLGILSLMLTLGIGYYLWRRKSQRDAETERLSDLDRSS